MRTPQHLPVAPPRLDAGEGVVLRGYGPDDVDAVLAMASEQEFQRWTTVPTPYERSHAEQFVREVVPAGWASGRDLTWAVAVDGHHAGNVSLRPQEGPDGPDGPRPTTGAAEIGFGLDARARGRGVMARAVRALLPWAADHGTHVVHWRAHVGNWASRRVAWSCGFTVEGTVRGLLPQRGGLHDAWVGSWAAGDPTTPVAPWWDVPRVELGHGLLLRAWTHADVPRVLQACTDPLTRRWLPGLPDPYGAGDAAAFVDLATSDAADGVSVMWAVADHESDAALASVTLFRLHQRGAVAEIGYWAHPDARGRGVVTAGVRAAVRHATLPVEDGGLGRPAVLVRCEPGNTASAAVAARAGFLPAGHDVVAASSPGAPALDLDRYLLRAATPPPPPS